jgi:hypothetical protein
MHGGARNLHGGRPMTIPYRTIPRLGALLLLLLPGCRETADTVDEAAEIATDGGVEHLRETERPAQGPPRVLVFALDGVGHEALQTALDQGRLPTLAGVLGQRSDSVTFAHGISAGPVLTVLPSITIAAWTALFTGVPPAESGVPGNEWFERGRDRFHAPAPVSVSAKADALETLSDQLLDSLVLAPTVFERADVRSYVSLLPVYRGADLLATPGGGDLAGIMAAFPKGAVGEDPVKREVYASVDRASAGSMADLVEGDGPPDLGVVYFPGIDLYTHAAPDPLAEQQRYLAEVTDSAMAEVLEAYRQAGALDGTWIVVVADHGHTPVPHDDVHALAGDSAFSLGGALEDAGFRVRPADLEGGDDHQAVMAWQGAFAYVYIADRSTCAGEGEACAWNRPPRHDEDLLAAARAVERAAAAHPTRPIDLVLLRDSAAGLSVMRDGEPLPLDDYLAASPRPELLRFADRLEWLTNGPAGDRAGDLIVMTRLGASVPVGERFYFSHPYHSWHASAEAQDSHAPLVVARSDRSGAEVRAALSGLGGDPTQLDFTPLLLALLERDGGGAQAGDRPSGR